MSQERDVILGIDLGTTNSAVSILNQGKPEVILIEGEPTMPSCVGKGTDGQWLVGRSARNQYAVAPERTALSVKRMMGTKVEFKIGDEVLKAQDISAIILAKLKKEAEEHLGHPVERAVITVPAYFDDVQRKATVEAGTLAGLKVERIINEPTAASLAYESSEHVEQKILVYDLGGGTFDASLVNMEKGIIEVLSSHGDTQLGGDDFDQLLMDFILEKSNQSISNDPILKSRLKTIAEIAKIELSSKETVTLREEHLFGREHLELEISREEYEALITPLVQKTLKSVSRCLQDASMTPAQVDKVILVGGSSRTPLVHEELKKRFKKDPSSEVNPDLIVTLGAAIQGGLISGLSTDTILIDITPHSFGVAAFGMVNGVDTIGVFAVIIAKGSPLPVQRSRIFYSSYDGQEEVEVEVYQGEHEMVKENHEVGSFMVSGLSPDAPAASEVKVNMELDLNGILIVTATEVSTGLSKTVEMKVDEAMHERSQEQVSTFLSEAGLDSAPITVISEAEGQQPKSDIVKRAEALLHSGELDEEDREELADFLKDLASAQENQDSEAEAKALELMGDLLFVLEN